MKKDEEASPLVDDEEHFLQLQYEWAVRDWKSKHFVVGEGKQIYVGPPIRGMKQLSDWNEV